MHTIKKLTYLRCTIELALSGHLVFKAIFHFWVLYFMFILWPTCLKWYLVTSQVIFMATNTKLSWFRQAISIGHGELTSEGHFTGSKGRLDGQKYFYCNKHKLYTCMGHYFVFSFNLKYSN